MSALSRLDGLWRHPDFLKLWLGQTVSLGGSLVSRIAIPLVAIITLSASPGEVAMLRVAESLPGVLIGLFAGVWVDRFRRRPLMIWADLGRAALLISVPLAALLGALHIWHLALVILAAGTLSALFEVAYHAYLPTLVSRAELVEGNSKLEASGAVVEVVSFGLAGWLVQTLTAPLAIVPDAVSFVVSALCLGTIRTPEPTIERPAAEQSTFRAMREGMRLLLRDPILRAIAGAQATARLFMYVWFTMYLVFLTRDLQLEPVVFGIVFAVGGICSFVGAICAERIAHRLGLGPTLIVTLLLFSLSLLAVPLASSPFLLVVLLVTTQQLADGAGTVLQIHESSLVQAIVPDHALGRVTASLRVIGWTAMLAGTVVGGVLGELIGPRMTLLVGAIGSLPAVLWLVWSPVRGLRTLPQLDVTA